MDAEGGRHYSMPAKPKAWFNFNIQCSSGGRNSRTLKRGHPAKPVCSSAFRLKLGFCTRLFVVNFLFHPQSTGLVPVCLRLCRQPNHPRYKPGGFSSPSAPSGACASPTDPKRCPATAGRVQATALQRAFPSLLLCEPLWPSVVKTAVFFPPRMPSAAHG